jgi:hypothetical protein
MWRKTQLLFVDLFLLKLIVDYYHEFGCSPSFLELFDTRGRGRLNVDLERRGIIAAGYATPMRAADSFRASIRMLRELKLLKKRRYFTPSQRGERLVEQLGTDWRMWPVNLPFEGTTLLWDEAVYLKEIDHE